MIKRLTKAEEEIMLILWKLGESTIRDVMTELSQPEYPVHHCINCGTCTGEERICRSQSCWNHLPLLSPGTKKRLPQGIPVRDCIELFDGSFSRMAAFFARENDLDMGELHGLISEIESELKDAGNDE